MMRMSLVGAAVAALIVAAPVAAQGRFDGTWKVDTNTAQMPTKPFGWKIANGMFECVSCTVPYKVPSDGAFHRVAGQPYWDETSVKIVDPMTITQTWRKDGKVTETQTNTVSADGKTIAWTDTDSSAPSGRPIESSGTILRVGPGAPGSHAMAGMWRVGKLAAMSDDALKMTLMTAGKSVTMTTPAGYHYTAAIGGPAVPVLGDQAKTMACLTMPNANTLVETDSRAGKTVSVLTMTTEPDARTMHIAYDDRLRGTTARYVATKE